MRDALVSVRPEVGELPPEQLPEYVAGQVSKAAALEADVDTLKRQLDAEKNEHASAELLKRTLTADSRKQLCELLNIADGVQGDDTLQLLSAVLEKCRATDDVAKALETSGAEQNEKTRRDLDEARARLEEETAASARLAAEKRELEETVARLRGAQDAELQERASHM